MAAFTLVDTRIVVGATDISQFTGSFNPTATAAMQPANVFGSGGFTRQIPGLRSATDAFSGLADYDADAIAAAFNSSRLGEQQLVSVAPTGGNTAGDQVTFTRALIDSVAAPGGAVGDVASFDMSVTSDTAKINGVVASPQAIVTATATGTILTLTGPLVGQKMYAGIHVTKVEGTTPSMTATVQSASVIGFGSPSSRIVFAPMTAAGWQFASLAGAVTDGFWRVSFVVSGTLPKFTCSVVLGVAP